MSVWTHHLYPKADIDELTLSVTQEHLDFYSGLVVAEARLGYLDRRSRQDFIVAVGAAALVYTMYLPQQVAGEKIAGLQGLAAVEAVDSDMPYWVVQEWEENIRQAFESFKPRPHETAPQDDSLDGYLEVLEQLRRRNRYPLRPTVYHDAASHGWRYVFSDRVRRAKELVPRR